MTSTTTTTITCDRCGTTADGRPETGAGVVRSALHAAGWATYTVRNTTTGPRAVLAIRDICPNCRGMGPT